MAADDRDAVTRAAHAIDQELRLAPLRAGESRGGGRRMLFHAPLLVTFRVRKAQRKVIVSDVRAYGRRT